MRRFANAIAATEDHGDFLGDDAIDYPPHLLRKILLQGERLAEVRHLTTPPHPPAPLRGGEGEDTLSTVGVLSVIVNDYLPLRGGEGEEMLSTVGVLSVTVNDYLPLRDGEGEEMLSIAADWVAALVCLAG